MASYRPRSLPDAEVWLIPPTETAPALRRVDRLILIAVLVALCGNLPAVLVHHLIGRSAPVWPMYLLLYGVVGTLLVAHASASLRLIGPAAPVLVMSMLPVVSIVWSAAPVETTLQAATLVGTSLTGFALAAATGNIQALRILAVVATLAPLLDFATILLLPSVGIEQDGPWVGTWRGLHDQKNGLGAYATLQLVLLGAYLRANGRLDAFAMFGVVINIVLLVAARSTTAWLTAAVALPLIVAPRLLLWVIGRTLPILVTALAVWLLVDTHAQQVMLDALPALVGKDSTLSNRLPIWRVLSPYLEAAPWLGYGYGAFWSDPLMPGEVFLTQIKFLPGSAHSSVVELRLALGWIGLAAMGALLMWYIANVWRVDAGRRGDHLDALMPLIQTFFVIIVLQSLTESILLNRNDLFWALFVWLAARLGLAARELRRG